MRKSLLKLSFYVLSASRIACVLLKFVLQTVNRELAVFFFFPSLVCVLFVECELSM